MKKILLTIAVCATCHELWHRLLKRPALSFVFGYMFGNSPSEITRTAVIDKLGMENMLFESYERDAFEVRALGKLADYFGFEVTKYLKGLGFPPEKPKS